MKKILLVSLISVSLSAMEQIEQTFEEFLQQVYEETQFNYKQLNFFQVIAFRRLTKDERSALGSQYALQNDSIRRSVIEKWAGYILEEAVRANYLNEQKASHIKNGFIEYLIDIRNVNLSGLQTIVVVDEASAVARARQRLNELKELNPHLNSLPVQEQLNLLLDYTYEELVKANIPLLNKTEYRKFFKAKLGFI